MINPIIFNTSFTEDCFSWHYLLGLIASDGNVSKTSTRVMVSFQNKDNYLIDWIKIYLTTIGIKSYTDLSYTKTATILRWHSKEFKDLLLTYGIGPAKSLTLEVSPLKYDYFDAYLRGIVDGDGYVALSTNPSGKKCLRLTIVSGSRLFLEQLQDQIISKVNVTPGKIGVQKSCECYKLNFSGVRALSVLTYVYSRNIDIGLMRKQNPFELAQMLANA